MLELVQTEDELLQKTCSYIAHEDVNFYAQYVFEQHQHPYHRLLQSLASEFPRLCIDAPIEHGKALPLSTPIPTPSGWTTMGALRRGDAVFDRRGRPCSVTFATPVQYGRTVYRLHFDDGSSIEADADHRWLVLGRPEPAKCANALRGDRVVTTAQMLQEGIAFPVPAKRKDGTNYHEYRWRIPLAEAVDYAPRLLPIHPYVLGAWLGDGNSADARITFGAGDRDVFDRCQALEGAGYQAREGRAGVFSGTLGARRPHRDPLRMREKLRRLGVLGNKHIPAEYLTASIEQRRELLAGLLDTDGSISGRKPRVELTLCNRRLAEDATELVRSLGLKASMRTNSATLRGIVVGERHRIMFVAHEPVFRLQRKLARQRLGEPNGRTGYRCVTRIEEIPSVPVRCIAVDSADRTYLAGRDYTVTHNTTQFDVVRSTWALGRNPNEMIAIISNSSTIPERALRSVRECLLANERYHQVFPHIEMTKATQNEIWLRRGGKGMHPSIVGVGVGGSIIGSRISLLILDDILDFANTWTENERKKLWELLNSTILNRLLANGRLIDIGTPWHVEDARHKLRRTPGYTHVHFDAEDGENYRINGEVRPIPGGAPGTLWNEDVTDPVTGHHYGFPAARLAEKKDQMPPHEYARQFKCVALSGSMAIFPVESLEYAKSLGKTIVPAALFKTETTDAGRTKRTWRESGPHENVVVTGVDLAIKKSASADKTALYTVELLSGLKRPLEICAGQMEVHEIARQVIRIVRLYPGHRGFRVEDNAAQDYLLQVLRNGDIMRTLGATEKDLQKINIRNHTTTAENKWDPVIGIRGMAVHFAQGKWPIPCDDRGRCPGLIEEWYDAMLAFDPTGHTNDILMASWLASEEARSFGDGSSSEWNRFGMYVPK